MRVVFFRRRNRKFSPVMSSYYGPIPVNKWSLDYFKRSQGIPTEPTKVIQQQTFDAQVTSAKQNSEPPVTDSKMNSQSSTTSIAPVCFNLIYTTSQSSV